MVKRKSVYPVPMFLLQPIKTTVKGVTKKTYPTEGTLFFGSFQSYGGTERKTDDVYVIEDTAEIETWYSPIITSDCRIMLENGCVYDIISQPENLEMRNITMRFKVRRVDTNG